MSDMEAMNDAVEILKREAIGLALADLAFQVKVGSRDYGAFFLAFSDAKRWDWDPDDELVSDAFQRRIEELIAGV